MKNLTFARPVRLNFQNRYERKKNIVKVERFMLPNGCDYALWLKRIFFGGRVLLGRVEGYDLFTPEQMKKALWT